MFSTQNESVEAAASFVFDRLEGDELVSPDEAAFNQNLCDVGEDDDRQYKMVFVVNTSLSMGTGKIAAQVLATR